MTIGLNGKPIVIVDSKVIVIVARARTNGSMQLLKTNFLTEIRFSNSDHRPHFLRGSSQSQNARCEVSIYFRM
jgi:hypothetical protein